MKRYITVDEAKGYRLTKLGTVTIRRLTERLQLPVGYWEAAFLLDKRTARALRQAETRRRKHNDHYVTA